MVILANALIIIASILWVLEYFPQLKKTLTTKTVDDLSIEFFSICFLAYFLYMVGNIILKNWVIVFCHIPSLFMTALMVGLILKYRRV